jgi:NADPH-dependent 2,4-dienoyl-CoA reductase/sulfur reductase-like enzyme
VIGGEANAVPTRIVIVGGGQAGARCAEALRLHGFAGRITIVAQEPVLPYERPPLSKSLLAGTSTVEEAYVLPPAWYAEHDVKVLLGRTVISVNRPFKEIQLDDGSSLPYDILILATGARPRAPAIDGRDLTGVLTLRDTGDAKALQARLQSGRRLVVIGAGLIGMEVAATARLLDVDVVVLDVATTPMSRVLPPEAGHEFAELHRRHGVKMHLGMQLEAIVNANGSLVVKLADGSAVHGDTVLLAVGVVPCDGLAAASGIETSDGVCVDAFGRTSDPNVYAIGDCARLHHPLLGRSVRLESWQHAEAHAQAVARSIMGIGEPYAEVPWAWSDQYDVNLQVCGAPMQWDAVVWRGDPSTMAATLFQVVRDEGDLVRVVGASTMNRARDMRAARRLIEAATPVPIQRLADESDRLV